MDESVQSGRHSGGGEIPSGIQVNHDTENGAKLEDKVHLGSSMINESLGCSSVEQDSAPLERLLGDGVMSPISMRRDSYEIWSSSTKGRESPYASDRCSQENRSCPDELVSGVVEDVDLEEASCNQTLDRCIQNDLYRKERTIQNEFQNMTISRFQDVQKQVDKHSKIFFCHPDIESVEGSNCLLSQPMMDDRSTLEEERDLPSSAENLRESNRGGKDFGMTMEFSISDMYQSGGADKSNPTSDIVETSKVQTGNLGDDESARMDAIDQRTDFEDGSHNSNTSVQSLSNIINESTGSVISVDITSTKKKIDESSHAFMEQLRGAANRRKIQVIQSRDSLRAKQKELKETTIAVAASPRLAKTQVLKRREIAVTRTFKALPLPLSSGSGHIGVPKVEKRPQTMPFSPPLGARRQQKTPLSSHFGSGQVGIPMVEKRPPTLPFSPLLGAKRQQKIKVPALQKPPPKIRHTARSVHPPMQKGSNVAVHLPRKEAVSNTLLPFCEASSLPQRFGHSVLGHIGIPKVAKRSPTVALSPMLGCRRKEVSQGKRRGKVMIQKSDSSIHSLVGLDLLSPGGPSSDKCNLENEKPARINALGGTHDNGYVPHSTKRAIERAEYDKQRAKNEEKNRQKVMLAWKREIAVKRAEIAKLRETV